MTRISGPAVKALFFAVALATLGLAGAAAPAKADVAFKPSAPLHVVTTQEAPTDNSIYVSWTAPVSDGGASISDYAVQYRSQSANSWSTFSHDASPATSIRVTGLSLGSIYMLRVAAVNSAGTGLWSAQESTISTGRSHACAQMEDGTVKCWGRSSYGQLGDGTTSYSNTIDPVSVQGITGLTDDSKVVSLNLGEYHSCAVMRDGTVKCWGRGTAGQLGNDFWTDQRGPVLALGGVDGTTAASTAVNVAAGLYFTCSAMADGTARCWGVNDNGQLGSDSGYEMSLYVPTAVNGINGSTSSTRVAIGAFGRTTGSSLVAPGAPGRPAIGVRTTSSVRISWTAAASNGSAVTNYLVEYRKGTGQWSTLTRADSTALSVTVTGLTKGGSYTFRVSAVSAGGTSAASVVSAAALAASGPSVPGSVEGVATKVAGQIKVTWKAGSLNGAPSATYKVSWLVGGKWTTPVTATGFAYTISKLKPGTYSVKVTATTSQGSASATKPGIVLKK